jgi:hypothetical protein
MRAVQRLFLVAGLVAAAGPGLTQAQTASQRQFYSAWRFSQSKGYYFCSYYYKVEKTDVAYKEQYVIYKPSRTKEWVYWYNPETKKYWARCATKFHPTLGDDVKKGADIWCILPDRAKKAALAEVDDKDFPEAVNKAPVIPGSTDGKTVYCPPDPPNLPD